MVQSEEYSAAETLRDGRRVEIRALKPEDQAEFLAAVGRTSTQALYRRFFSAKRQFTDAEVDFFVNVDFRDHVALVAVVEEQGRATIVGGGRYITVEPGRAELAFMVVDAYHGKGIGSALMRHLAIVARAAGLQEFVADVLPENASMLKLFRSTGLMADARHVSGAVHVILRLT